MSKTESICAANKNMIASARCAPCRPPYQHLIGDGKEEVNMHEPGHALRKATDAKLCVSRQSLTKYMTKVHIPPSIAKAHLFIEGDVSIK